MAKKWFDSYRVPSKPIVPGSNAKGIEMDIIESMPVKSVITYPINNTCLLEIKAGSSREKLMGEFEVSKVEISIDFGANMDRNSQKSQSLDSVWQKI